MDNKITAVEWLIEKAGSSAIKDDSMWEDIERQAKEMEKQQIMEAYDDGELEQTKSDNCFINEPAKTAETYYKETYGE